MLQFPIIGALLGLLLVIFSLTMLVPIVFAVLYAENTIPPFLLAFTVTILTGLALWLPNRRKQGDLRTKDGFLITALFWFVLGIFGALPLWLSETPDMSLTNAIFESVSGLTTTGATVITGLDTLPKSILYYRQQLQWLGGIGIIVIAVAILPMLGIGGMQLYRAETPGPMKDNKLTPRITGTAKALFLVYLCLTICCGVAYWLAGMTPFDALAHSFSTIAIGGFSTHDASMAYFESPTVLMICTGFMLVAGVNFALHYYAFMQRRISVYSGDPECRFYLFIIALASLIIVPGLAFTEYFSMEDSALHGIFQVVSIGTTTGFVSTDFSMWPTFLPILVFLLAFGGACAGSTGGGMKAIRVLLIVRQGYRELAQLVHPNAIIPVKMGGRVIPDSVVSAVWSFFAVYVIAFFAMLILLMATGLDFLTAFSAIGASINNLGPGLGEVTLHYDSIPAAAKWILCFAMLMGRLEVFTLLVLFTPAFWRR